MKAHYRGEFEEWGGLNDLSKTNAKAHMEVIYHSLKVIDPKAAYWNKIIRKSHYSPDKYGVVAKRDVERGTVLGFFKGDYVVSDTPVKMCGFHKYEIVSGRVELVWEDLDRLVYLSKKFENCLKPICSSLSLLVETRIRLGGLHGVLLHMT